ncbi:DUF4148 domain-containing protein [Burkholderia plantarii]|uniref:DUF4148 domain-containing protein n=1 Tax=Burkholderia plantarii TaxID=41899 RepID=UPI0005AEF2E1|nr:DUF4148 domain-containing protein [Burkholderia plantarii]
MLKVTRWSAAVCAAWAACIASLALAEPAIAKVDDNGPLTRAAVRAELVDAQRDGFVPTANSDYPPSAVTVARNRERYAIAHRGGQAESGRRAGVRQ